jgi:hypothetical protein
LWQKLELRLRRQKKLKSFFLDLCKALTCPRKPGMTRDDLFNTTLIQQLINILTPNQMTIPDGSIYATVSTQYHEVARSRILEFLGDDNQRMVTFGYSSGGSRAHCLYRCEENGIIFFVFITAYRGTRVYYLRKWLLYDVFEDLENTIPDFTEAPPLIIER